jgi:hypothetical protein
VFPELRRAYGEGLIGPRTIGRSELDDVEASPRGDLLGRMKDRYPPIDDIARATSWWAQFAKPACNRRAAAKVGRNQPCPCGSGKKYKKCCGA